jgi:hypothetical protein
MAADYTGALAAIREKFLAEWTGTPLARVGFVNEAAPVQIDDSGAPVPWVLFELVNFGSVRLGFGMPGASVTIYDGAIKAHMFVPTGSSTATAVALAVSAGEIFRNEVFYDAVTAGCHVRTGYTIAGPPRIENGEVADDDGAWFNVTATIPFEYWHRA